MLAEQVTGPVAYHGEGPVWSEGWGGLRWVDMLAGDVLYLAADGAIDRRHVGTVAAALRPRSRGGAVIGVERGFALEEPDGTLTTLAELWTDTGVRMNEGGCDPDGRFYCGSMAYDKTPEAGAPYRPCPAGPSPTCRPATVARTASRSTPRAASGSRSTTAARSAATRPTAPPTQSS